MAPAIVCETVQDTSGFSSCWATSEISWRSEIQVEVFPPNIV